MKWFAWGANSYGSLGLNNTTKYSSPVQVGSDTGWTALIGAQYTQGATNDDGQLWTVGENDFGQLGNNTQGNPSRRSSPVQIPGTTWNATNVNSAKASVMMCIKTDGTLWTWGQGVSGNLAQNNQTYYSSPVQIPGTSWSSAFTHGYGGGGVKTDGTLWMWGANAFGNLGQNDRTQYSSPIQIPGTTWKQGVGAANAVGAVKTDGTLWVWGYNDQGSLGLNSANSSGGMSSPTQIPGTTWDKIGGGNNWMTAIKTDGTLWSWGQNTYGQLGDNSVVHKSSPVQVGSDTTWNTIRKGYGYINAAIKTDGTLWTWGNNPDGALGQNNDADAGFRKSSPVQVPGTTWEVILSMPGGAAGLKA